MYRHILSSHVLPAPVATFGTKTQNKTNNNKLVNLFSACRFLCALQTGFNECNSLAVKQVLFLQNTYLVVIHSEFCVLPGAHLLVSGDTDLHSLLQPCCRLQIQLCLHDFLMLAFQYHFLVPDFHVPVILCYASNTDSLSTLSIPISDVLPLVHSNPFRHQEISMETKTKEKKRLCSGVSLALDMFYVHFTASHFCLIPQTSLHYRKVTPHLVSTKQGLGCSHLHLCSHRILIIREQFIALRGKQLT